MLNRKITTILENWKKENNKKALLVKGLRQIGKTYIIDDFCRNNYQNYIYVNFKDNDTFKRVFDNDFDINRIIMELSLLVPNSKFEEGKTIIFLDEIQDCARARASLKPFVLDGRFDVIASGSLLGLKNYNQNKQDIPVGYERIIQMYPLDFEEFLWAMNVNIEIINLVKDCFKNKKAINPVINETFLKYFRQYLIVGGMPSIVNTYIETNNINLVKQQQEDLINDYKDDFGKHLDDDEKLKVDKKFLLRIQQTFSSIPYQLAKENKKFCYNEINNNVKAREYYEAIRWLIDYGLIVECHNLNTLEVPLESDQIDNSFKLYFIDTGLFMSQITNEFSKEVILNDMKTFKGPIYENMIADGLSKNNKKLYYYHKKNLEIDFVTIFNDEVNLLEVKAKDGRTKSARTILNNYEKYHVKNEIKLSDNNIGFENNIFTIPYYLIFLIK